MKKKLFYTSPECDIIKMTTEGVIATSGGGVGDPGGYDNGGDPFGFGGAPIFF